MGPLQQTIKAVIRPGDQSGYVAECLELAVVTQGRTLDETVKNLQEATALHLEGESPASFRIARETDRRPDDGVGPSVCPSFVGSAAATSSPFSTVSAFDRRLKGVAT